MLHRKKEFDWGEIKQNVLVFIAQLKQKTNETIIAGNRDGSIKVTDENALTATIYNENYTFAGLFSE